MVSNVLNYQYLPSSERVAKLDKICSVINSGSFGPNIFFTSFLFIRFESCSSICPTIKDKTDVSYLRLNNLHRPEKKSVYCNFDTEK